MSLIRSILNDPFFSDDFGLVRGRRQDPFDALWRQQQQLLQAADQAFQGFPTQRTPPVHVSEENGEYIVEAELPGVRKEDLDVRVSQGGRALTIEGHTFRRSSIAPQPQGSITEHKEGEASPKESKASQGTVATTGNKEVGKANGQAVEGESTYQSTFSRSFTFPKPVDGAKIAAKFENGLLTLTLPQLTSAQDLKVQIA